MQQSMQFDITGSVVLYKHDVIMITKVICSFLDTSLKVKLYLIDNSPTDVLKELQNIDRKRIVYIFNNANLGFGKGHNIILKSTANLSKYHVVLNPDIYFDGSIMTTMYHFMQDNEDAGQIMPKILYPNGQIQRLCKQIPRPLDLFGRRFLPHNWMKKRIAWYEMHEFDYDTTANIPSLSGCFMFLRQAAIQRVGFFDEVFFMYLEDLDLCQRIGQHYKTIFLHTTVAYHEYQKGSYKYNILFLYHIRSAIHYFNKHGWFPLW